MEPEFHPKGWGNELWIVNNKKYCGKKLSFQAKKRCSWHYHKIKDETFFVNSGRFIILYGFADDIKLAKLTHLKVGDSLHIPPETRHQIIAIEDSVLYEFSTQHFETDSYRIIKGD